MNILNINLHLEQLLLIKTWGLIEQLSLKEGPHSSEWEDRDTVSMGTPPYVSRDIAEGLNHSLASPPWDTGRTQPLQARLYYTWSKYIHSPQGFCRISRELLEPLLGLGTLISVIIWVPSGPSPTAPVSAPAIRARRPWVHTPKGLPLSWTCSSPSWPAISAMHKQSTQGELPHKAIPLRPGKVAVFA